MDSVHHKKRPWWQFLFSIVDRATIPQDEKDRLRHYTVFVMIGFPFMVAFGLYNLAKTQYLLSGLIAVTDICLLVSWILLTRLEKGQVVYRVAAIMYFTLLLYMVYKGGHGGSKILWMYSFPLIAFFLLGREEGLFWACIVFVIAAVLILIPADWLGVYPYHSDFKIRFLTSFAIVTWITSWFEYMRQRYRKGMRAEHRQLEHEQRRLHEEIIERKKVQKEKEALIEELQQTLDKVQVLQGLIPICSSCHSIRDDQGFWNRMEAYIQKHSDVEFSHGICPACKKKLYPELYPDE